MWQGCIAKHCISLMINKCDGNYPAFSGQIYIYILHYVEKKLLFQLYDDFEFKLGC